MKVTEEASLEEESASAFSFRLRKFSIKNGNITYLDMPGEMKVSLGGFNLFLGGNFSSGRTTFDLQTIANNLTYTSNGISYLNRVEAGLNASISADLENQIYSFQENEMLLNDLALRLDGQLDLSEVNPFVKIGFETVDNSFKSIISLIPSIYQNEFKVFQTEGTFSVSGRLDGHYIEADSIYPDLHLNLDVENAMASHSDYPASMEDIDIALELSLSGRNMDSSTVNIDNFSFKLSGNPFKTNLYVRTPVTNPEIKGLIIGRVNVSDFLGVLPFEGHIMSGNLDADLKFDFNMADVEEENYENIEARGRLYMQDFEWSNPDIPVPVFIEEGELLFSPSFLDLTKLDIKIGSSDFHAEGKLDNYLLYYFKDQDLSGSFNLQSNLVDLNELIPESDQDSIQETDSTEVSTLVIPKNIDFNAFTSIDKLIQGNMELTDLNGRVLVNNGRLILDGLNMKLLQGVIQASGEYNTSDSLSPYLSMNVSAEKLDIPTAFNNFNTVQAFAPFAKNLNGMVSANLFYTGKMSKDLKPILNSISGEGKLQSKEVQILNSKAFDQLKKLTKLNKDFTNTFEDINTSFGIKDGRVVISPFDVKVGNIPANFSGDHGLDHTLNYLVKMQVPRKELGAGANALIDEMSKSASLLGIPFTPGEFIPVNLKITGSFLEPQVNLLGAGAGNAGIPIKDVVKEGLKQEVEVQKEKLEKEIRNVASEEADKIIKQAESEVEKLKEVAAEAAEKIRKEGYAGAERVEKEAEGKGWVAENLAKKAASELKKEADKQAENVIREANEKAESILNEARKRAGEISKSGKDQIQ